MFYTHGSSLASNADDEQSDNSQPPLDRLTQLFFWLTDNQVNQVDRQPIPRKSGSAMTLSKAWETLIVPDLDTVANSTLEGYRGSLRIWGRYSGNPPVDQITEKTVRRFRNDLIKRSYRRGKQIVRRKRSAATVNKIMRELHVCISPLWPADRKNSGGKGLLPFFKWPRALKRQKQLPFVYTPANLNALYLNAEACRQTVEHQVTPWNDPRLWRLALVLALNTGARTWDLFKFQWSSFRLDEPEKYRFGSIVFTAKKTGKLHRIPLNECAYRHLMALKRNPPTWPGFDDRIFPRFYKGQAFYRIWGRICQAAGVVGTFESMRKTCVTRHNNVIWQAGLWLSGHVSPGIFGDYDNPSDRIFEAVYALDQPTAFLEGMRLLEAV